MLPLTKLVGSDHSDFPCILLNFYLRLAWNAAC